MVENQYSKLPFYETRRRVNETQISSNKEEANNKEHSNQWNRKYIYNREVIIAKFVL